jgi:membrane fusion protein, multidrug efflux system
MTLSYNLHDRVAPFAASKTTARGGPLRSAFRVAALCGLSIAGAIPSQAEDAATPIAVTVQAATAEVRKFGVELTGAVAARKVSEVGFRISGRLRARNVDVGDRVTKGQILANMEADVQNADVFAAEAALQSADATYRQREADFQRQVSLLENGVGTEAQVENAQEQLQAAAATQTTSRANLGIARDSLANTILRAPVTGVVTARKAEEGQVVEAAQSVYAIAEDGDRDAVFEVYEALLTKPLTENRVDIRLVADPSVHVTGTVREVSPVIDTGTGTIRVKVGLPQQLPAPFSLGAPVAGTARFDAGHGVAVPWQSLSREGGTPAVWVVDAATNTVLVRPVTVSAYRSNAVLIGEGLGEGDLVVTSGLQFLKPGIAVEPRMQAGVQ